MKIAILGSAPSSLGLAPFADPSFAIWACSPGTYGSLSRCDAFFELHRWEPGVIGVAASQKPWFSPEYVQWMATRPPTCNIWMADHVPGIPNSKRLPVDDLLAKYGSYFFTSSIAWMLACAMEDILEDRQKRTSSWPGQHEDVIALYGVDMAATEEYGYQRAGCQHFLMLAANLGITIQVPPESDLLRPMPLYGIDESSHVMIKITARKRELTMRLNNARANKANAEREELFVAGALDDLDYMEKTWGAQHEGIAVSVGILAHSPALQETIRGQVAEEEADRDPQLDFDSSHGGDDDSAGATLSSTGTVALSEAVAALQYPRDTPDYVGSSVLTISAGDQSVERVYPGLVPPADRAADINLPVTDRVVVSDAES